MKFRIQARLCLAYAKLFKVPDYRYKKKLTPMWLQSVNIFLVISVDL